jgi:hypothetical protein
MIRDEDIIPLALIGLAFLSSRRVEALLPRTKAKVEEVSEIAKEALKTTPEQAPELYQQLSQAIEEVKQTAREENVSEVTALQALAQATAEKLKQEGYQVIVEQGVTSPIIAVYYQPQPTPPPPQPSPPPPSPPPRPPVSDVCRKPDEVIASPPPDRLNTVDGCLGGFRKAEVYQIYTGEWKTSVTIFYSEVRKPQFEAVYTVNLSNILQIVKPSSGKIGISVTDMFGLGELHIYIDGVEYQYGVIGYRGYVEIPLREYASARVVYKPKIQADQDVGVDIVVVMYP